MLLRCCRGLLVIWGILHQIIDKFDKIDKMHQINLRMFCQWSLQITKRLGESTYVLNNLTNISVWILQIMNFHWWKCVGFFPSGQARNSSPIGRLTFISNILLELCQVIQSGFFFPMLKEFLDKKIAFSPKLYFWGRSYLFCQAFHHIVIMFCKTARSTPKWRSDNPQTIKHSLKYH